MKPMSYPSVRKRCKLEREAQRPLIAAMRLRGLTQVEIAKKFGLTQSQINRDLKAYYRQPFPQTLAEKERFIWKALAQMKMVEKELWESWNKSTEDKIVKTITKISREASPEECETSEFDLKDESAA
jgi:hypothetical protein